MPRDPRYDILFEPVEIGPKTAPNRFFQVPHCNGMGHAEPRAMAAMRGVKAEGGWGVVCTEETEIHRSGDIAPYREGRLVDDGDIPAMARMVEAVHEHGALAGVELCHNGMHCANVWSHDVPLSPSGGPVRYGHYPTHARAMDKADIREMRRWHVEGALRARKAGFDLVYVYAGHQLTILSHFLSRRTNQRSDEYGGSLENRARLFREVLEETKDAVGHDCAVPVRISMDELEGASGIETSEIEDVIAMVAEVPDLWDICLAEWPNDSQTARFSEEGFQEPFLANVKKLTTKPVVGVGRYTSPDKMVSLIKGGVLDMIGAARPSIADPFLPKKIEEGRLEDIRECIGCNICVSCDFMITPIRCTQNPSMGEEYRRGWHPERIRKSESDKPVLIVGAGPAGLEAAQMLGKRGYAVTLADKGTELGGRLIGEARLPGLSSYIRVRDYREQQLHKLPNVEIYFDSDLDADGILEFGFPRVVLATGARWRRDATGDARARPVAAEGLPVFTPDDIMAGTVPEGRVLIWDDDHYYMGGVLAELLTDAGCEVTLATPAAEASAWTHYTMEQHRIQTRLLERGVTIRPHLMLDRIGSSGAVLTSVFTEAEEEIAADAVLLVTARDPVNALTLNLADRDWQAAGIERIDTIGDANAPATVAHAVHAGRRYAEELDHDGPPMFRHERPA